MVVAFFTLAWVAMLAMRSFADVGEALVALGIACVVPLGVGLAAKRDARVVLAVRVLAPIGLTGFLLAPGPLAGAAASAWLLATLVVGLAGAARIARRGALPIEELAIDVGHLYLPVGGIWLLASRSGHSLLGFHEPIVLYTANHFHFAGFAAPVVMGLVGRELGLRRAPDDASTDALAGPFVRRVYTVATCIVLAGIPLVAAGIQLSRSLEQPAAILLGAGMLGASMLLAVSGARRLRARGLRRVSGVLLAISGASLVLSMTFAVLFALTGSATRGADAPWIPFSRMALVHGVANAVGFATLALAGFSLAPPPRRTGPLEGSWPTIFGRGFIGPDFFDRIGAIDGTRSVDGQLGSLDDFAHASFAPSRVHPGVRDFYEHTSAYELRVEPEWHRPFRIGGRVFAWFARTVLGQLELPTAPEHDELVSTRLFAVRAELDGRTEPRGYVRTLSSGARARASYVAVYSTHRAATGLLLSSAFPLPFSSLLGVLRFEDGPRPGGLTLSSRPRTGEGPADEGMFLVTRLGAFRLPVDERLEVWSDGALRATHDVHVLGLHAFTLRYSLERRP
jgi:hypothetical protein